MHYCYFCDNNCDCDWDDTHLGYDEDCDGCGCESDNKNEDFEPCADGHDWTADLFNGEIVCEVCGIKDLPKCEFCGETDAEKCPHFGDNDK